jgi:hypothetical protein
LKIVKQTDLNRYLTNDSSILSEFYSPEQRRQIFDVIYVGSQEVKLRKRGEDIEHGVSLIEYDEYQFQQLRKKNAMQIVKVILVFLRFNILVHWFSNFGCFWMDVFDRTSL